MTFSVNGIKQEKNEKHPLEILVCVDAPLLARKILEEHTILILSLKEFSPDKKTFGDIYFTIKQKFQEIDIVTKYTDIQEACNFFTFIGFDIIGINSYSKPLSQKEVDIIIATAKSNAVNKETQVREQIEEMESAEKKIYADEKLQSAKKIIARVFEKVDETTKRSASMLSVLESKKLAALSEELKKLRMGTNFEKIREVIQDIFTMLESINYRYFKSIRNANDTISPESLVTYSDVDKQQERMENVKILKSLGAKISFKNQDYATFGSSAIYRKFLQKDLRLKLSNIWWWLYGLYDIVELVLIIIIALLGVYTIANQLYLFSINSFWLAFSLLNIGIRGLVLFVARYCRNTFIGRLLVLIVLAVLLHYTLMRGVTSNFAL